MSKKCKTTSYFLLFLNPYFVFSSFLPPFVVFFLLFFLQFVKYPLSRVEEAITGFTPLDDQMANQPTVWVLSYCFIHTQQTKSLVKHRIEHVQNPLYSRDQVLGKTQDCTNKASSFLTNYSYLPFLILCKKKTYMKRIGSACGVMVIVLGNGHGDTSSNPGRY